jgi:leucyl aminopeptidase (aminopeptidase T)
MDSNVMTFEEQLESYANLIVSMGLNIQTNQRLLIQADVAAAPFAQRVARHAYQRGARLVSIYYEDDALKRSRFELAPKDSFGDFFDWQAAPLLEVAEKHDSVLGLFGSDPELLQGFDTGLVSLEFSNGRVIRAEAKHGLDALEAYLEMDAGDNTGTRFLGEVALVESGSPVEQSKVLFKRALLDENAASHIALGFAYRHTIGGGESMSREDFQQCGGNTSLEHRDIMLGSSTTDVDGLYADGRREPLMRQGKFVMED